jgi:hypothetical protein
MAPDRIGRIVGGDEAALVAAGQDPAHQEDVSRVPLNGGRRGGRYLMGNESDALLSVHALTGSETTPDDADPASFVSLRALPGNVSTATARNHSLPGNGRAHRGSPSGIRPQTLRTPALVTSLRKEVPAWRFIPEFSFHR